MELSINGQVIEVAAEADSPLLWAIRDFTDYTGTKFGCGIGACGACTVLIDGQPVRSCQTLAADVGGAAITTIEGLSAAGDHPVQRAWIEEQVPQCGYCQSGMILAAVALLDGNPVPDDADIDAAITNICRCGTYARIRRAIHRAAEIIREEG